MMKIIAITTPQIIDEDVFLIKNLLERGIDIIHFRKPGADINVCRQLLLQLTKEERTHIVIHDFPELYVELSLKGIHINRYVTSLPNEYNGCKTRSCHSFEEVVKHKKDYDYLFLSPIFDSISKAGYKSGFNDQELLEASNSGIIDEKVIALGGVTFDKIPYLKKLNFGGVAMIGGLYNLETLDFLIKQE